MPAVARDVKGKNANVRQRPSCRSAVVTSLAPLFGPLAANKYQLPVRQSRVRGVPHFLGRSGSLSGCPLYVYVDGSPRLVSQDCAAEVVLFCLHGLAAARAALPCSNLETMCCWRTSGFLHTACHECEARDRFSRVFDEIVLEKHLFNSIGLFYYDPYARQNGLHTRVA